jgi:hypothetical protein
MESGSSSLRAADKPPEVLAAFHATNISWINVVS